jgi:hypothetical protein
MATGAAEPMELTELMVLLVLPVPVLCPAV